MAALVIDNRIEAVLAILLESEAAAVAPAIVATLLCAGGYQRGLHA